MHCRFAAVSLVSFCAACAAPVAQAPEQRAFDPVAPPAAEEAPPQVALPPPAPPTCTMFVKPGTVRRQAVVKLLDAGLPRWLQGVEGDRALSNHRFQGWLIKSLHPNDPCYRDIGLLPGDIVQKINGRSIEKPEQAFDVAESLRTAPAIVVDLLRNGSPQKVTIAIAND